MRDDPGQKIACCATARREPRPHTAQIIMMDIRPTKASLTTMNKVSIGLCTIGVASAAAPLCTTTPDVLDADLALKICIGLFGVFFLQFLLVPWFFLQRNFKDDISLEVRADRYQYIAFFMRLMSVFGFTFLYLVYTLDNATIYPVLCAVVAVVGVMGPIKAELIFNTEAEHIVASVAFLTMGTVLCLATI